MVFLLFIPPVLLMQFPNMDDELFLLRCWLRNLRGCQVVSILIGWLVIAQLRLRNQRTQSGLGFEWDGQSEKYIFHCVFGFPPLAVNIFAKLQVKQMACEILGKLRWIWRVELDLEEEFPRQTCVFMHFHVGNENGFTLQLLADLLVRIKPMLKKQIFKQQFEAVKPVFSAHHSRPVQSNRAQSVPFGQQPCQSVPSPLISSANFN